MAYCWRFGGSLLKMWWLIVGDVVTHCWRCGGSWVEMWWLIGCAPAFWGRGPGFVFGISHNDSDALLDHCVIMYTISV